MNTLELMRLMAYKIRVMLSHVRIKRDQYVALSGSATLSSDDADSSHPPILREIYDTTAGERSRN